MRRWISAISAAGKRGLAAAAKRAPSGERAGDERHLRADDHRDDRDQSKRRARPVVEAGVADPAERCLADDEADRRERERGKGAERRVTGLVAGELLGVLPGDLARRAEARELDLQLLLAGDVVGELRGEALARGRAHAAAAQLVLELGDPAHASTDSIALERSRHSLRRSSSAPPPARVSE